MGSRNNKPGRIVKGTAKQPNLKDASGIWSLDEAMQAHRANAWPQPNLFQPVANSLRLDGSRQTVLSRTISRSGNQQTWTWSGWFKPSTTAGSQYLFVSTNTNGNPFTYLYFSNAVFRWWDLTGSGGTGAVLNTNAVYRDTNAWYHVVLAVDTTQSTESNRAKLYINGVQVTSFTATSYPLQGAKTYTNSSAPGENVAYISAPPGYVYGYLAEVNFVDGYQLDPSLLGKFDTNNTWVPVAYTGTYGTNGFYLPFTNTTTSQTLGYDASVNGTTTYDANQDPYRGSVALHLTGNGPVGGQNNTFTDGGPNQLGITRSGSTITQGSFSPFPLQDRVPYNPATHGGSAWFNNTPGDYLLVANNYFNSNNLGTGVFTVECWAWIKSGKTAVTGNTAHVIMSQGNNASNLLWTLQVNPEGTQLIWGLTGASASVTTTIPLNSWVHFAITRDASNSEKIFVNGALVNTRSNTSNYSTVSRYDIQLGTNYDTNYPGAYGVNSYSNTLLGYISSTRIIVGTAVYTAAFTPTNKPFGLLTNNLLPFSEDISNSTWSMANSTVRSSAGIAPDGTPSACLVVPNTSSQQHYFNGVHYASTGSTTTLSFYAKASGYGYIQAETPLNGGGYSSNTYDLITGTVVGSQWDSGSLGTATITSAGNGWWLCTLQNTNMSPSGNNFYLGIRPTGNTGISSYAGDGVSGIYVWGVQLEVGATATTYTPTPANFRTAPTLLLNFANAAVVDTSGAQNFVTVSNATISSSSKYGSGALTFNGSSDYLQSPAVGLNGFGASDFTIEAWINFSSVANGQLVSAGTGGQTNAFYWQYYSSQLQFGVQSIGMVTGANWTPTANIWYHVCVMRQGPNYYQFIDGQQLSVATYSQSWVDGPTYIGYGGAGYFNGKMDDVRITRGVARYSFSGFTPPARALPEMGGKSFVTTNVNAGVVQRFTTTGTTSWTAPTDVTSVEVLVVAGGGGGGGDQAGGGGGGGGVIYNNQYAVTPGQTYTVVVGAGGAGDGTRGTSSSSYFFGATGGNSQFGNLIALGGGGGASMVVNTSPYTESRAAGRPGGSGGGASNWQSTTTGLGGAGTAGQGFSGGSSTTSSGDGHQGGGGGGAGGVGADGLNRNPGAGGAGLSFGILGTPYYFAGGGGGGTYYVSAAVGGIGGGGGGASNTSTSGAGGGSALNSGATGVTGTVGGAGGANTGGGGGGAGGTGGAGGSGIVVVRYTTTAVGNTSDATTDNLTDSPTQYGHDTGAGGEVVGNYATLNPLVLTGGATLSNGNLNILGSTAYRTTPATIAMTSGKWYWENRLVTFNPSTDIHVGVCLGNFTSFKDTWVLSTAFGWGYTCQGGLGYTNNTGKNISSSVRAAGDTIGLAFDADAGNLYAYVNGVVVNGGSPIYTGLTSGPYFPFVTTGDSTGSVACNFGQRAWAYAPPAGFNALTTKNLPRLAIGSAAAAPNQFFDTVLYTGSGATQTITMPGGFTPDFVWIKRRNSANSNLLADIVRGNTKVLLSNDTGAELTDANYTTFVSGGFSVSSNYNEINNSGAPYVAWCWRAGGAAVSNTSGTITSQVSANTTSGFSIVTWTGVTGGVGTMGHGLATAPKLIITKQRNQTGAWYTYTTAIDGSMDYFLLNTNAAKGDSGLAVPTSTVFSNDGWTGTSNMIAYCWAEVAGFSKFGTYIGTGGADGPFVYLGFTPRFVMVKKTDSADQDWYIWDSARSSSGGNNALDLKLYPNQAYAENGGAGGGESTSTNNIDAVSNGFKLRTGNAASNASSGVYIYMAFAAKPFGNVNGTAR